MRVQTVAILIVAMVAVWETQEAPVNSQPSVQNPTGNSVEPPLIESATSSATLVTPPLAPTANEVPFQGVAKYGDYVAPAIQDKPSLEVVQTVKVTQKVVKDIQIRFVNNKGQPVDDKGQPIQGRTQKDFIIGELRLKRGQAFRDDLLERDLRRLRRLEPFKEVNVSLEEDETGVNIIYDIKESRFPAVRFGAGENDDNGIYGSVGYRDANIGGVNDKFDVEVQVSANADVQFKSQFTSPYRAGEPNRPGYSIRAFRERDFSETFTEEIELPNGDRVREGRLGGGVALLRSFNDWDGALGLNYTRISNRDGDYAVVRKDEQGNPLSLSGTGIDDLVTVSFAINRDERDRRVNPTQGSILTLSTEQAIPIGLGNVSSNRLRANYIQYVPLGSTSDGRQTDIPEIVAFNLQAGTTIGDFPPADAFNLGGLNSVRGYESGKVASGRSYVLASVEYRFPVFDWAGGVVFTDFASDLGSGDTVLGKPGVVRDKPGTGFGFGVGLRVKSPIGLLRGDLGISDQGEVRFDFSTGQRF